MTDILLVAWVSAMIESGDTAGCSDWASVGRRANR